MPVITRATVLLLLRRAAITVVLVLVPLAAAVTSVAIAPAAQVHDVGLDGLNARVELHIGGGGLEINSGVLGGVRRTGITVLGKPIGLSVSPSDLGVTLFGSSGSVDPNATRVIGHLFADPQARRAELDRVTHHVAFYYAKVAFAGFMTVVLIELLGYLYLKSRRRALAGLTPRQRSAVLADRRVDRQVVFGAASAVAAALLVIAGYLVSPLSDRGNTVAPEAALDGTFLDGWRVSGPFTSLVLQAVSAVDLLGKEEQLFYDTAADHLRTAFTGTYGPAPLAAAPGVVHVVFLDDLQGTSGMARIVGQAAHEYGAGAIVNLGDMTATGTTEESYLAYLKKYTVEELTNYAGSIPLYTSLGRHDTSSVVAALHKRKVTIADGRSHPIAGLSMLGANSPYIVEFGQAARLVDPSVTTQTVADRVTTEACATSPLIVYAHDTETLNEVANSGCVPIVIGGHSYVGAPVRTVRVGAHLTRQLTLGSTGGHGLNDGLGGLTTPRNPAPFTELTIDRTTGAVSVDRITVGTDASVTLDRTDLPALTADDLARLAQ